MNCFLYPDIGRVDEPLQLHLDGLKPFEPINISMTMDHKNITMESSLSLEADENGKLIVSQYTTGNKDVFSKLIWNLQPTNPILNELIINSIEPLTFQIKIEAKESNVTENRTIVRLFRENYVSEVLLSSNIEGTFYYPKIEKNVPAIIVLGRQDENAYHEAKVIASLLASHGYGALAVDYNHKKFASSFPIEHMAAAIQWLLNHPSTHKEKIIFFGLEKGAELALLTASKNEAVKGVIALSPTSHVFQSGTNKKRQSSWTEKGNLIPFVPFSTNILMKIKKWQNHFKTKPMTMPNIYGQSLNKYFKKRKVEAEIPVENIQGPLLLLSAEYDQYWPSSFMGKNIIEKLEKHSFLHDANLLTFPNAEKLFIPPYLPTYNNEKITIENAQAGAKAWQEIISFLNKHFPAAALETESIPFTFA